MRSKLLGKLLLVLAGLMALGIAPAGAAESLLLSCEICDEVIATGKGLPPNADLRLTMADVKTGQDVIQPTPVRTDASGAFVKKIRLNLRIHPALESSVWRTEGSVLVVAAHSRPFTAPCKLEGENLPLTGARTPLTLGLGGGLLLLGALLVRGSRRRPARHAR